MTKLDVQVIANYKRIFALPKDEQIEALDAYWSELSRTCTSETPCIECLREAEAQREFGESNEVWGA